MTRRPPLRRRGPRGHRAIGALAVSCLVVAACASGDDPAAGPSDPASTSDVAVGTTAAPREPSGEDGADAAPPAAGWLSDASFVEESATELDTLHVEGIDTGSDLAELDVVIFTSSGPVSLPIYREEAGLTVVAPLHPDTPGEGGDVDFQFVAGDSSSDVLTVSLDGLPPADGAFDAVVDGLKSAVDRSAASFGSSLDELTATDIDDVGPDLLPLKLVQGYVDDGTDNDLQSLPDALDLTPVDRGLLDATVAKLDLLDSIGTPGPVRPQGFASAPVPVASPVGRYPDRPRQAGGGCTDGNVRIDNAEQLIDAIEKGVDAIIRDQGAEAQVLAGIQSIGATLTSLPLGAYGDIIGVIADMFSLIETYKNSVAGQYPTVLESVVAQVTVTEFNEDFKEDGRVTKVDLTARSTGWDASALVATATGAVTSALSSKLTGRLKDQAGDDISAAVIERGGKLRDSLTGQYIDAVTAGNYSVCPQPWTVDITDTRYVALERVIGRISVDDAALTYKPVELGEDVLRVRADSTVFSGLSAEQTIPIDTKRLRVIATPERVSVQRPGETVSITTRLEHADTTTLAWHRGPGRWDDGIGDDTNEPGTRPYVTPTDPNDYPYVMEIESTSTTGLRATATDARNDSIVFELAEIRVSPNPGDVEVRKQLEFGATDKNGAPVDVRWEATGGTIPAGPSKTATYTAGNRPGSYLVTATLASNPAVSVTVPVIVGEFCLSGTWRVNADEFARLLSDGGVSARPAGGRWDITVNEDRTFNAVLDNFSFAIEVDGIEATIVINGSQSGTIIATATQIQGVDTTSISQSITVNTPQGSFSASPDDVPVGTEFGGGPYYCENGQLIVNTDGYDVLYDRVG